MGAKRGVAVDEGRRAARVRLVHPPHKLVLVAGQARACVVLHGVGGRCDSSLQAAAMAAEEEEDGCYTLKATTRD